MTASPAERPTPLFHRPLKMSVVLLVVAGVGLAATAAIAAFTHDQGGQGWVFVTVALVLGATAILIALGVRWVIAVCMIALAGQLAAIVGTAVELIFGIAEVKQRQLTSIGFDPTFGVLTNLVYSTAGFGLFCWLALRFLRRRVRRPIS